MSEPPAEPAGTPICLPGDRYAFRGLLTALAVLAGCHLYYALQSGMVPSWDEAHYMLGAHDLADAVRSGSPRRVWNTWCDALETKPPLACLPAAAAVLVFGNGPKVCLVALVPVFFALGVAGYSLFRNCLAPTAAAVGAILLATSPLVTGLTHRYYVENLLLLVWIAYLDVLLRHPWNHRGWTLAAGGLLGAGLLCKTTFAVTAVVPTAYLLAAALRAAPIGLARWRLVIQAAAMTAVGLLVAFPWYRRNWHTMLEHARRSLSEPDCDYPALGSLAANLTHGPHSFAACLAVVGLAVLLPRLFRGREPCLREWVALLLTGAAVLVSTVAASNKAVRFSVLWLPTIAALAAWALVALLPLRRVAAGLAAASALSAGLVLRNSFDLLPLGPLRVGDLRLLDSRFALNIPDWYDDNHPLDRRDFSMDRIVQTIDSDAAARFGPGAKYKVRLTVNHLLASPEAFLLAARGTAGGYELWPGTVPSGPAAPEYILRAKGVHELYPGRFFGDYYPEIEVDAESGRIPYRLLTRLAGPDGVEFAIFVHSRP